MDTTEVTAETAGLTRWINHTAAPQSIPGHHLTYDQNNYGWCSCGRFCGSGAHSVYHMNDTENRTIQRQNIRDRFELHLARLHQGIEW